MKVGGVYSSYFRPVAEVPFLLQLDDLHRKDQYEVLMMCHYYVERFTNINISNNLHLHHN